MVEIRHSLVAWARIAVELGRRGRADLAAPIRATVGAPTPSNRPERFPNPDHLRWYDAAEAAAVTGAAAGLGIAGDAAHRVEPCAAVAAAEAIVRAHHRRDAP